MSGRIAIVGSGANGTNIGVDLVRAGHDVTFIDPWPAHVEAMRAGGARIVMPHETIVQPIDARHICDVCTFTRPFDYAFIVLKAYDARWGTELILPHLKRDGLIVAIQNGMTAEEVAEIAGPGRSIACVLEISAGLYDPGTVIRDSPPDRSWFAVGSLDDSTCGREHEIQDLLRHAGTCEIIEDILSAKWMKLVSNSTTIPTTSLLGMNLKEGEEQPGMRDFMLRAGQEASDVGEACGYKRIPILGLTTRDIVNSNRFVETMLDQLLDGFILRETRAGVLQDWEKGRQSEAGDMNGLVERRAAEHGLSAPACRAVAELSRRIETGSLKPGPENLELLLELEHKFSARAA
ncbi:MAG: hypothetical protein OXF88_02000 [Rhodobacteraceae bacterium]|nr:hypothetical protein [Paracoccaceae bacterium]MCY4140654.1 hypothetical protein [Paracoccaceae bacterium]